MIELLHIVKTRPTPSEELEDEGMSDEYGIIADSSADNYGVGAVRSSGNSVGDSAYSPMNSPPHRKATPNGISNGIQPPGLKPTHGIYRGPEAAKIQELKVRWPPFPAPPGAYIPFPSSPDRAMDRRLIQIT